MPPPCSRGVSIRLAVVVLVTIAGGLWLYVTGPHLVVRGMTLTDEPVPLWYMLAAFPVLGALCADVIDSVRIRDPVTAVVLTVAISAIVVLSAGRLSLLLPMSGHALVFAFAVVLRVARRSHPLAVYELCAAVGLSMATATMKLWVWSDPLTLGVGSGIGVMLAVVTSAVTRRTTDRARAAKPATITARPRRSIQE
jgi:hypothetical protein